MATGPAFVANQDFHPFDSVDLFDLFTAVLDLPGSAANNGTYGNVRGLLLKHEMSVLKLIAG